MSSQKNCVAKENFKEKGKLVTDPDGGLTPEQTGRLTVGRKITLTLMSRRWVRILPP
jgi:hypothetical protein